MIFRTHFFLDLSLEYSKSCKFRLDRLADRAHSFQEYAFKDDTSGLVRRRLVSLIMEGILCVDSGDYLVTHISTS